jgi:hypothetical protein
MTQPEYIRVADDSAFLAVSAANFANADTALFKMKAELAFDDLTPAQQAHLDQLRQRRKDAYADLVTWVMKTEDERIQAQAAAHVTPVTSARGSACGTCAGCGLVPGPFVGELIQCHACGGRP